MIDYLIFFRFNEFRQSIITLIRLENVSPIWRRLYSGEGLQSTALISLQQGWIFIVSHPL